MNLLTYNREQLDVMALQALTASGVTFTHEHGRWRGKPLGRKRTRSLLSRYMRDLKALGRLVEIRPHVMAGSHRREAKFVFVPQQAEFVFSDSAAAPSSTP